MYKAVVVIPVYREELKATERASLEQAFRILGKYDICFMAPEKMRGFLDEKGYRYEWWPDECFESRGSYSRLLLTVEFYRRFINYDYMLVYQLDAFVFADRMQEFCGMNYDYMGAPMPYWSSWRRMETRIGNGGFSLRKIHSCIRILENKREIYDSCGREEEFEVSEDKFFGFCGSNGKIDFRIPDTKTALLFSIEYDIRGSFRHLSSTHLPFGCHAWSRQYYFREWEPYIKNHVDNWAEVSKEVWSEKMPSYRELRARALRRYLLERIFRYNDRKRIIRAIDGLIPGDKSVIVWGNGAVGHRCRYFMKFVDRSVEYIFDKSCKKKAMEGISILTFPDLSLVEKGKHIIVIATSKFYDEIADLLRKSEMKDGQDFYDFRLLEGSLIERYYDGCRWMAGTGKA